VKRNMGMALVSLGASRLALGEFVSAEVRWACCLGKCSMVDRTAKTLILTEIQKVDLRVVALTKLPLWAC
jgi:hypothetical protein